MTHYLFDTLHEQAIRFTIMMIQYKNELHIRLKFIRIHQIK